MWAQHRDRHPHDGAEWIDGVEDVLVWQKGAEDPSVTGAWGSMSISMVGAVTLPSSRGRAIWSTIGMCSVSALRLMNRRTHPRSPAAR
jgi:hypothetical protein